MKARCLFSTTTMKELRIRVPTGVGIPACEYVEQVVHPPR